MTLSTFALYYKRFKRRRECVIDDNDAALLTVAQRMLEKLSEYPDLADSTLPWLERILDPIFGNNAINNPSCVRRFVRLYVVEAKDTERQKRAFVDASSTIDQRAKF